MQAMTEYMTGPTTGPRRGPILNAAVAAPIFSFGNASAITPPPTLRMAEPPIPAKSRSAINVPIELASAQPTWNTVKMILPAWIIGARPYNSDNGARNLFR